MPVLMILGGLAAMVAGAVLICGGWFGWDPVLTKALHGLALPAAVAAACFALLRFSLRFAIATPKRG